MLLGTGSLEIKKEYKVDIVVDPYYGTKEIIREAYLDKWNNVVAYKDEVIAQEAEMSIYREGTHTLIHKCDSLTTKKLTCCLSQNGQALVESKQTSLTFVWKINNNKVLVSHDGFVVGYEGDDVSSLLIAPTLTENVLSNISTGEVPASRIIIEGYGLSDMNVTCEVNSL